MEPEDPSTEEDLVSFLATQTEEFRSQAAEDYPELAAIIHPVQSSSTHSSPVDPVLAIIARHGIGPTDAYIMAANTQPTLPIMSKPVPNTRLDNGKSTVSALSCSSTFVSDLENSPP